MRSKQFRLSAWATAALACALSAAEPVSAAPPALSAQAYMAAHGGTLAPAGTLEIDGRRMTCGRYPTVLDPHLNDFGEAYLGLIVLNPRLFAGLATPVKLWIYSHECGHESVGRDESKADCAAVRRGRREGWLTEKGLAQVCAFMQPAHADSRHFSGPQRCAFMRQCFQQSAGSTHR